MMAMLYRLISACRKYEVVAWDEAVGGAWDRARRGQGALDAVYETELHFELARHR